MAVRPGIFFFVLYTLCPVVLFSGCTAAIVDTAARSIFQRQDVNLIEKNYAAADYLIDRSKGYVSKFDLIEAQPLQDTASPAFRTDFGRTVSEHIGIRLAELGYRVNLVPVYGEQAPNYLKPVIQAGEKPGYILSGTYRRHGKNMDINLRITGAQSGRVFGAFSYTLPLTRDIAKLSEAEPVIIRITD